MERELYLNISPSFKVLASVELFLVGVTVLGNRELLIKWLMI